VRELERALVTQARDAGDLACASYTHLQPAQPIRLAHWWLAHVEALARDEERFAEAREAADRLPLGSGAVAGSPLRYDRASLATRLGFSRVAMNSLDAVGDRDFAVQYLNAAALLGIHLSRLSEDLVLYCSPAFGWFKAPDGFSTGSSLLPQKRNPDLFELARGKSARLLANAQRLATLLKGLPSSYMKDLQEDKEAVFDSADTLELLLAALPPAVDALVPQRDRIAASLTGDLLAVELADALVGDGVPFRDAHRAVGALWAAAEQAECEPAALPLEQRLELSPYFTDVRLAALSIESAIARRAHAPGAGSTPHQLAIAEARLGLGPGDDADVLAPDEIAKPGTVRPTSPRPARPEPVTDADAGRVVGEGLVLRPCACRGRARHRRRHGALRRRGHAAAAPVSELYQCVREFHVVERVATNGDAGATRVASSRAPRSGSCGATWARCARSRCGRTRTARAWARTRAASSPTRARSSCPRIIALTREVGVLRAVRVLRPDRESIPRKVWTDCVRCPSATPATRSAMTLDLVPAHRRGRATGARLRPAHAAAAESNDPSLPSFHEPTPKKERTARVRCARAPRRPEWSRPCTSCWSCSPRPTGCAPCAARPRRRGRSRQDRGARVPQAVAQDARVVHRGHARAGRRRRGPGRGRGERDRTRVRGGRGARALRHGGPGSWCARSRTGSCSGSR
jgi:argininosuccinate lyase